jgi:hypothetical protein
MNASEYYLADVSQNRQQVVDDIAQRLVSQIETILGYTFRPKFSRDGDNADEKSDNDEVEHDATYYTRLYRCSQDTASANYSKYISQAPPSKRRRRNVPSRYPCAGRLSITAPNSVNGAKIRLPSLGIVEVRDGQILVRLRHNCNHPARTTQPVPQGIRNFIRDPINA